MPPKLSLPRGWKRCVRSSVLHILVSRCGRAPVGWGGRNPREVNLAPCDGNTFLGLRVADSEHTVMPFWTLRIMTLHDPLRCLPY